MMGVTIGDDVVIGARSVVTHDIPSGVLALGHPAKPVRSIGPRDRLPE
jgi:acetyltransferase-like isoleucine patch superfamily enzyme